jgi:tetratricopeptide (TPR) repeat protein
MRAHILAATVGIVLGALSSARGEETAATLLAEARAALAAGRPHEALDLAGKAIEDQPDSRAAYRFRAELLERTDEHERAIADYDKLIELDPDQAELYDLRGSAQFKLGRIDESIADFDKAIELAARAGALEAGHLVLLCRPLRRGAASIRGISDVRRQRRRECGLALSVHGQERGRRTRPAIAVEDQGRPPRADDAGLRAVCRQVRAR